MTFWPVELDLAKTSSVVAFTVTGAVLDAASIVPCHHAEFNQQRQWILCAQGDHLFHDNQRSDGLQLRSPLNYGLPIQVRLINQLIWT